MIAMLGTLLLILALFFSLSQSLWPLWRFYRHKTYALVSARSNALAQFICIALAYALLMLAFAANDFSIAYVGANSHASLPLLYKLTALWGAHEGSILLWVLILSLWTMIFSVVEKKNPASALTLAILGLISFAFLCFLLLTSNPFLPALTPLMGRDLNPLLQDPGFVTHPPMLYAGYVGFSVAFAITEAALLRGKLDAHWARLTRRFAIAAWCCLTLGITLGSWWAYRVLGWGGFWFWDPVENASLLPWLSGTALIHVLVLAEKRNTAKNWATLLAIISFALSLLGTFLVRSGVLISAHTFANDPARGVFLLLLLGVLATAALAVYVLRLPIAAPKTSPSFHLFSRENILLINSAFLMVAMTTILLGTLYPLLFDALHLGSISVGAPYFNLVMAPLVLIMMVVMGMGPLCNWQRQSFKGFAKVAVKKILLSLLIAFALLWGVTGQFEILAFITLSLSLWVIQSLLGSFRALPAMSFAHTGFAILMIGIMLSSSLNEEREVRVKPGDQVGVGPYQFLFLDTQGVSASNYKGIRAAFDVTRNHRHIINLYPEKRIYTVREMVMTTVDIHPGIFRDLYIALGEPLEDNYWSVRLYYKPFVRWIWFGGLLMMLGGLFTLMQRRSLTKKGPLT